MKRSVILTAIVACCLLADSHPAFAGVQGNGDGGNSQCLGLGYLGPAVGVAGACDNGVPVPSKQPSGNHKVAQPKADNGDYWVPIGASVSNAGYGQCPNGSIPSYVQEYDAQGQPIGQPEAICPSSNNPTPAPAPAPPPPPQVVWAQAPLPTATLRFDPGTVGLTQLPTWFWASGVGQVVSVTVGIEGYTLAVKARPVAFTWYFGDGTSATATTAGSPTAPSVEHTYSLAGTYQVRLTIMYEGAVTYDGPAGAGSEGLPSYLDGPFVQAYTVQQVKSVLVAPPAA